MRRDWPYFSATAAEPGHVSARVGGVDPGAPRALELWRTGTRRALVGRTVSDAAGRFDFGQQLLPLGAAMFQVVPAGTPAGIAADAPAASRVTLRHERER